jgi:hypothetical protein
MPRGFSGYRETSESTERPPSLQRDLRGYRETSIPLVRDLGLSVDSEDDRRSLEVSL